MATSQGDVSDIAPGGAPVILDQNNKRSSRKRLYPKTALKTFFYIGKRTVPHKKDYLRKIVLKYFFKLLFIRLLYLVFFQHHLFSFIHIFFSSIVMVSILLTVLKF